MNRKGQSAIEYLTTYGWMLLVVAIVGGAIFTTVQDNAQTEDISGMSESNLRVTDFGVNENGLQMKIASRMNQDAQDIIVSIGNPDGQKVTYYNHKIPDIAALNSETTTLPGVERSESTNKYQLNLSYASENLGEPKTRGIIRGKFKVNFSGNVPTAPTGFQASQ